MLRCWRPLLTLATLALLTGCCEGDPDNPLCQWGAADAGLGCWSEDDEPVRTTGRVEAPDDWPVAGCEAMSPHGWCLRGPLVAD
ncbi:MAG: hypothetical protein H6703_16020, partial [Myxococcales bacterium]|nr:hypothetical protein [Myxococcales bacterium]